jgi:hypothetical protein
MQKRFLKRATRKWGTRPASYCNHWTIRKLTCDCRGVPPEKTIERLHEIATGGRLNREPPQISARGMAFRSIAKLDRTLAETLVDYECCREYLQGIEHWLAESEPNSKIYNELLDEARWLRRD